MALFLPEKEYTFHEKTKGRFVINGIKRIWVSWLYGGEKRVALKAISFQKISLSYRRLHKVVSQKSLHPSLPKYPYQQRHQLHLLKKLLRHRLQAVLLLKSSLIQIFLNTIFLKEKALLAMKTLLLPMKMSKKKQHLSTSSIPMIPN